MVAYVYHRKPDNMIGSTLYPLNRLKDINTAAYDFHKEKYSYRLHLMETILPIIGCKWNDVLHMCPVDIGEIVDARRQIFRSYGHASKHLHNRKAGFSYYKINIDKLNKDLLFVYDRKDAKPNGSEDIIKCFYTWVDGKDLISSKLPKGQVEYFHACAQDENLVPYLFTAISHVFYYGTIDTEGLEEVFYDPDNRDI
jgi:hypothetical protein